MSPGSATSDLWWKNAVLYCLDVQTFFDSDADGCGDFKGLSERIDYLAGLGVTCIWLMPFFPSPERDDGYDIVDFYAVDPKLGTLGDVVELVRTASDRGIRVIADLVLNHTSIRHPWFQSARSSPDSPYHDFYVWQDEKPEEKPGDVVFPDQESSNWTYDRKAQKWYLHRFYSEQPDLNVANPRVRTRSPRSPASGLRSACRASGSTPCRSCSSPPACRRAPSKTPTSCCATCAPTSGAAAGT